MNEEQLYPPMMPPQDYHDDRMPMPTQEQSDSAIIYQLDAEQINGEIEHSLRGEKYDADKDRWIVPEGFKPLLNNEGVEFIMGEIKKRVNRNTFLSFLTDENIDVICSDLHKILTDTIILNWEKWGMDKTMIKSVVYGVMDTVHIALRRAMNKTTLDYLKKSTQIRETINRDQQQNKRFGIF